MAEREPERVADVSATVLPTPAFLSAKAATGDDNEILVESLASPAGTFTKVKALGVVIAALVVRLYARVDGVSSAPPILKGR